MNKTHLYQNIYKIFPALLIIFTFYTAAIPENTFAFVPNNSVSADEKQDDNFDKTFREGRDLIDKQEWKKAAEKFNEVINQYPDNKSTDAALYWLAFCYKKQREFEKMGATVDRLLKDFPQSSWTSDARVLLIEVATPINGRLIKGVGGVQNGFTVAGTPLNRTQTVTGAAMTPAASSNYYVFNDVFGAGSKITLDREDEIRLAAFRSLLFADRQKALNAMSEMLKSDSKSTDTLKIEVLRTLRRPQIFSSYSLSTGGEFSAFGITSPVKPATTENTSTAPLREILVKAFQETSNAKIRREIIYTLASLKDEASVTKLGEIYNSESDVELKKAIINGLGSSTFAFGGFSASNISRTAMPSDLAALSEINSAESATRVISTNKLLEIVRTEKNSELRRLALSSVQRFREWNKDGQMTDILSQIYDSEADEAFKKSIIQSLARANQPQAAKKLLDIAKNDKSDQLKLEAIRALGQSKDPEALKYLEDIIK